MGAEGEKKLIEAAHKYYLLLPAAEAFKGGEHAVAAEQFVKDADARASWIIWPQGAEPFVKDTAVAAPVAPRVIKFNEATGAQLNEQLPFLPEEKAEKISKQLALPWRKWKEGLGLPMGTVQAQHASAVAVLHCLHAQFPLTDEPIDVWEADKDKFVTATAKLQAQTLMLPPCIPKQMKLVAVKSVHPLAAKIIVKEQSPAETRFDPNSSEPLTPAIQREVIFFAHPEFMTPTARPKQAKKTEASDASDPAAVAENAEDKCEEDMDWDWSKLQEITMHPYWALRRMTNKQMDREIQLAKDAGKSPLPRFNCTTRLMTFSNVSVGVVKGHSLTLTRTIEVPFLTNDKEVEKGEELFLEVHEAKRTDDKAKSRRWTEAHHQQEEQKKKKLKADQAQQQKVKERDD